MNVSRGSASNGGGGGDRSTAKVMQGRCRTLRLLGALLTAFVLAATMGGAAHAEELAVTPGAGNPSEVFIIEGWGFVPGSMLDEYYVAPDGMAYRFFFGDVPSVVRVEEDGFFIVSALPAHDFPGASHGHWQARFCYPHQDWCWVAEFDVYG